MAFKLSAYDRIIKAKISLQKTSPFFSHLLMNMAFTRREEIGTMGVNAQGNAVYNTEWTNKQTPAELTGVLCHETLHVALGHLSRLGAKDEEVWNIACDIAINYLVNKEKSSVMVLPKCGFLPKNGSSSLFEIKISAEKTLPVDAENKTADEMYAEIMSALPPQDKKQAPNGTGSGEGKPGRGLPAGFDKHDYTTGQETPAKTEEIQKEWGKKLIEASIFAQSRGKLPAGIARLVGELLNPKIDWRQKLYQFITNDIICNYTYRRPSRKSYSTGFYMPSTVKESLNITVAPDTSGSIDMKKYTNFMSEVTGIAKAFAQINMDILFWDTKVAKEVKITRNNSDTVMTLEPAGGGGTHMGCVKQYHKEKGKAAPSLIVWFTDGFVENKPDLLHSKHLFIVWSNATERVLDNLRPYGEVICIPDEK